jgi:diaminohydroxyphosphoribosylaminopyrimidine deaminase / 5-amino-6-(5-phosphoribosylamino)uracil reductase
MSQSNSNLLFMKRCLELAKLGSRKVMPNPMVGAVIVHNGEIIGEGYHQEYGQAHAEVNAINSVSDKSMLSEATIYVSLEPCAHFGKTPPCSDLIIQHQFKKVVIACEDSFKEVAGRGIEKIKNAGIEVEIGILKDEALELNKRFFNFHAQKRPYIILKWAESKDGFIDKLRTPDKKNKINWISSPETKTLVHKWRSEEHAILVGNNTIKNDNPSLTVRQINGINPIRIILDSQAELDISKKIFNDGIKTIVLNLVKNEEKNHIHLIKLDELSIDNILLKLFELNIQSVFVEGGKKVLQSFIDTNLWDEARIIQGNQCFNEGLRAPTIQKLPDFCESFSNDKIYTYFRR